MLSPLWALIWVSFFCACQAFRFSNWDRVWHSTPSEYAQPASEVELAAVLTRAHAHNVAIRAIGAGHSFSPLCVVPDGRPSMHINLDRMSHVLSADPDAHGLVRVQAGIRLRDLNPALERMGRALENMGEIDEQSIAGAMSTATHGTGLSIGSIASAIAGLRVVLANGTIIVADARANADVYLATVGGLGAVGIVSEVTLRTVPAFRLRFSTRRSPSGQHRSVRHTVATLPRLIAREPRVEIYFTPHDEQSGVIVLRRAVAPNASISGQCWPDTIGVAKTEGCIAPSWQVLVDRSDLESKYTEIEIFFPVEDTVSVLNEFLDFQDSVRAVHDPSVELLIGLRWVKGEEFWMAPTYQRNSCVISFMAFGTHESAAAAAEFELHSRALQEIGLRYRGRPHFGKRSSSDLYNHSTLRRVLPRLDRFAALRDKLDPKRQFLNQHLEQLLYHPSQEDEEEELGDREEL